MPIYNTHKHTQTSNILTLKGPWETVCINTSSAEVETELWIRHLVMACHSHMDNALIQPIVEQGKSTIPDDCLFVTLVVKCLMVHAGKQIPSAMCCLRLVLNLLKISLCFFENFFKAKHSLWYSKPCRTRDTYMQCRASRSEFLRLSVSIPVAIIMCVAFN